jgi:hypothetical protein
VLANRKNGGRSIAPLPSHVPRIEALWEYDCTIIIWKDQGQTVSRDGSVGNHTGMQSFSAYVKGRRIQEYIIQQLGRGWRGAFISQRADHQTIRN